MSTEARSSQVRTIAVNTLYNGVAQAATMVSTLVFLPLLIKSFGAGDYGVLVLASSLGSWTLLFDLGMSAVMTKEVAAAHAREEAEGLAATIASGTAVYTAIGLIWSVVLLVGGRFGYVFFDLDPRQSTLFMSLMSVTAASQAVYWISLSHRDALAGLQRFDLTARVALFLVAGEIVGAVTVLILDSSPLVLVGIRASALVLAAVAYRILYSRATPRHAPGRPDARIARGLVNDGLPIFTMQVAQLLNKQQADRVIVGVALGPEFVTIYEVAAKLASLVSAMLGVTTSAILPVASRLNAKQHVGTMRTLFEQGSHLVTLLIAPITSALIVVAPSFLVVWGGVRFEASGLSAQMLLGAQLLLPLYAMGDPILISKGRFGIWVAPGIALAVANVVLSIALVSPFGVEGVVAATLLTGLAEAGIYMQLLAPEIGMQWRPWLQGTVAPLYGLLLIPVAIALIGVNTALADSVVGIAVLGLLSVGSYLAVAAPLTLTGQIRSGLLGAIRSNRTTD